MVTFHWLCLWLIVALLSVAALVAAPPEAKKEKDDSVEQVRKAAETAEVHGVGVGGPMHFRLDGITEYQTLIGTLRAKEKKAPVNRVWGMLSKQTQKKVLDDDYFAELGKFGSGKAAGLEGAVAGDLRGIIDSRPDFYTEEAFKDILLTKELKDLIAMGKKRTFYQTAKLNWALLEKVFPTSIPEMPERFRTVRVQVVAGKDVILVLSSRNTCRWEVKLRDGAKVTGVILCGGGASEVVGVDAPVVYRCYYEPDGVTQARERNFYATKQDTERFKEFANCVKQLTGKDFTSFTSGSPKADDYPEPGDEPYTVRPSTK